MVWKFWKSLEKLVCIKHSLQLDPPLLFCVILTNTLTEGLHSSDCKIRLFKGFLVEVLPVLRLLAISWVLFDRSSKLEQKLAWHFQTLFAAHYTGSQWQQSSLIYRSWVQIPFVHLLSWITLKKAYILLRLKEIYFFAPVFISECWSYKSLKEEKPSSFSWRCLEH